MFKNIKELSTTLLLIVMLLGVSYIGGLDHKKTVAENPTTNYIAYDLN